VTLNCSERNFNEFQTALSDMNMQNQFNKMSVFECQTISENIDKLKQGLISSTLQIPTHSRP
jgi:hypothetical protein